MQVLKLQWEYNKMLIEALKKNWNWKEPPKNHKRYEGQIKDFTEPARGLLTKCKKKTCMVIKIVLAKTVHTIYLADCWKHPQRHMTTLYQTWWLVFLDTLGCTPPRVRFPTDWSSPCGGCSSKRPQCLRGQPLHRQHLRFSICLQNSFSYKYDRKKEIWQHKVIGFQGESSFC